MAGVTGCLVMSAVCRVCRSAVSSPWRIQSVRPSSSPLSKTELSLDEAAETSNGAHSSPAYAGSE